MADLFWLSDDQWAVIEPFMPRNQPGPDRKDDRQIISGMANHLACDQLRYPISGHHPGAARPAVAACCNLHIVRAPVRSG